MSSNAARSSTRSPPSTVAELGGAERRQRDPSVAELAGSTWGGAPSSEADMTARATLCYRDDVISQSPLTGIAVERKVTFADWTSLPEDEPGELVDGRLVEEEVPDAVDEVIAAWVIGVLGGWLIPQDGLVLGSEAKYAVSAVSGRKPDASAYMPQSRKPPRRGTINTWPDIMVEVISPTPRDARRDRVEKLQEYAPFGVRWYWIIDPQERTLEILELGADRRYAHARSAADGIVASVSGPEGLSLDLDALWSEVELLGPESGEGTLGAPEDQWRCRHSCGTSPHCWPAFSPSPSG